MDGDFNVVFYNTPHYINNGKFSSGGYYASYITLEREGNYVLFNGTKEIDFITEVIKY